MTLKEGYTVYSERMRMETQQIKSRKGTGQLQIKREEYSIRGTKITHKN
jgi:hypothetical protein